MPRTAAKVTHEDRLLGPMPFAPKGLSRTEAARHIGVSTTTFDKMVGDGRMPRPKLVGSRVLWDRYKLEAFFDALPEDDDPSSDDYDSFADWK